MSSVRVHGLGDFLAFPVDVMDRIAECVTEHGVGHALSLASVSKSMNEATWPAFRELLYGIDDAPSPSRFPAIHELWDPHFFKNKKVVRVVVRDRLPNTAARVVSPNERFRPGVMTACLDWKDVAGFLGRRPGIDVVLLDACMYRWNGHAYLQEHAVVLALAHIRMRLVRYPCELFSVLPGRADPGSVLPCRTTRDGGAYDERVQRLLAANGNSLFVDGPKSYLFGEGASRGAYLSLPLSAVAKAKRMRFLFTNRPALPPRYLATGDDTTVHLYGDAGKVFAESGVVLNPRVPVIVYGAGPRWDIDLDTWPARSPVFVAGDATVRFSGGVVHSLKDGGKQPRFCVEDGIKNSEGACEACVVDWETSAEVSVSRNSTRTVTRKSWRECPVSLALWKRVPFVLTHGS